MTIGTKSRKNTHKYIEHDGEMMEEDEDDGKERKKRYVVDVCDGG
jgi:hypothetical protein